MLETHRTLDISRSDKHLPTGTLALGAALVQRDIL